jgi:protease-4
MKKIFSLLKTVLRTLWRALSFTRSLVANLLFLLLLAIIMVSWSARETPTELPERAALLLQPVGTITEAAPLTNPWEIILRDKLDDLRETPLQDLRDAIHAAADDPRIELVVLDPSQLDRISLSQALTLGRALDRFRQQGKKVIAVGDGFGQNQYLMVCHADEIILDPFGEVGLKGLGYYRLYGRQALEKLKIKFHLFRAGEYKSALEPFIRDDMSEADRRATTALLANLWQEARSFILAGRKKLTPAALSRYLDDYEPLLTENRGDAARTAKTAGLVDRLMTRPERRRYLAGLVGADAEDSQDFAKITLNEYLDQTNRSYLKSPTSEKIALIIARGEIMPGSQPDYRIGAEDLAELLNRARRDDGIKAVVLRINSGGGSMTASETIRQELLALKAAGKPVVVSMGPLAASGAYWIAVEADEIWAESATLTGSIGVFGAFPSFTGSLDAIGVHSDGVATGPRAGALNPARPLPAAEARILQLGVNQGYRRFLTIVASQRRMSLNEVKKIAGGRVWSGRQAQTLGLVDHLGSLAEAVAAAAARVGLTPDHTIYWQNRELKPGSFSRLLDRARGRALSFLLPAELKNFAGLVGNPAVIGPAGRFQACDPRHLYAWSLLDDFTPERQTITPGN